MPSLDNVVLGPSYAFFYKTDVTIIGGIFVVLISQADIGDLYPFFNTQTAEMYRVCSVLLNGSEEVTNLAIGNNVCQFENVTTFDLSVYPRLKTLSIGNNAFSYVNVLNITGLNELESVVIGKNSFTKEKNGFGNEPNRHFYLKNCPKLRELIVGRYSFSDYSVIEIDSVNALETIVMDGSYNFYQSSLELKSILIHRE